jgi:hypothetical protein
MELIVELRVSSAAHDLAELDRALHVAHDTGVNRGDVPHRGTRAASITKWYVSERSAGEHDFNTLLARLMQRVTGCESHFASLVSNGVASAQVWFVAYLYHDERWPGLSLTTDALRSIAGLHARLEVDVYMFDSTQPDGG